MKAINHFGNLHDANLPWHNTANIVMLPKKEGAEGMAEYRPISLIHAFAKIIAKILAMRLGPHMGTLIFKAQSSFIKRRRIHDKFMYVRNLGHSLHKREKTFLLFKLDI